MFVRNCALGLAAITLLATPTMASDRVEQAHNAPQAVSGELSIWLQGVIPTGTSNDEEPDAFDAPSCSDEGSSDFCAGVLGLGGYAGVSVPVGNTMSVIADLTIDAHSETDAEASVRADHAFYGAIGVHLVHDAGDTQWGVFGIAAGGMNNEDDDAIGPVFGGGGEVRWHNIFAQAGVLHYFPTDIEGDDTIETLYFGRAGGELDLGPGMIEASLAVGGGDFDESREENDSALWVQVAAEYEMPITGYINGFVGYQGDYVRVDDSSADAIDQTFLHTVRAGLTVPFGAEGLAFKTPNFRAPLSSAGELN